MTKLSMMDQFNKVFNDANDKTYVLCHNTPNNKYHKARKNKNFYSAEDLNKLAKIPNVFTGWYVQAGFIVVDVDDAEQAKKVYEIIETLEIRCWINKTSRGYHFIFKENEQAKCKNDSKVLTLAGFEVDYRVAGKGYIILPTMDNTKQWDKPVNDVNSIDPLPAFLFPIAKSKVKPFTAYDILNVNSGNRNGTLRNHFLNLVEHTKYHISYIVDTMGVINSFNTHPAVDITELETICRVDETTIEIRAKGLKVAKEKEKKPKKAEEYIAVTNTILDNEKIIVKKDNGFTSYYIWNDEFYECFDDDKIKSLIMNKYYMLSTMKDRSEVLDRIKLDAKCADFEEVGKYQITLGNGVIDLKTKTLTEHDFYKIDFYKIDFDYLADASVNEKVEKIFKGWHNGDEIKKKMLFESIGLGLLKENIFEKAYMFVGGGGNGKSKFLEILHTIFGERNSSTLGLKDFNDKFRLFNIKDKLVNLGDDISSVRQTETDVIKSVISSKKITIEKKKVQSFDYKPQVTLYFNCNKIPKTSDFSEGYARRWIFLEFKTKFTKSKDKVLDVLGNLNKADYDYILTQAINAISDAINVGALTEHEESSLIAENHRKDSSIILEFLDEYNFTADSIERRTPTELFEIFKKYADECNENIKNISRKIFITGICEELDITVKKAKGLNTDKTTTNRFMKKS